MKAFKVTFRHTDKRVRQVQVEAFDKERAILKFKVNWGEEMVILNVVDTNQRVFDIPNAMESIKSDFDNKKISLEEAALQIHIQGFTNYVDMDYAKEKLL